MVCSPVLRGHDRAVPAVPTLIPIARDKLETYNVPQDTCHTGASKPWMLPKKILNKPQSSRTVWKIYAVVNGKGQEQWGETTGLLWSF